MRGGVKMVFFMHFTDSLFLFSCSLSFLWITAPSAQFQTFDHPLGPVQRYH
jgi:hypothetical protein